MPQTSKMKDMDPTHFTLVETPESLDLFWQANKNVEWMAFDSEFMGEKRFLTSLCLIQVATRMGTFLIDPLALKNIDPVLEMIQNPSILKITHAGENDYRLLYAHFGILPRNVFDTQIAAGFIHYKYPLAFKRLVETELRVPLKKGYTVADWEARPFKPQQLEYAVYDILPLHPLWELMQDKLQRLGRGDWVREECLALEQESYYAKDPHHEVLSNQMIRSLNKSEQLFMLRLLEWRGREAERKN